MSETTTRALRFHGYGDPAAVLRLEEVVVADPPPQRIRATVGACGLNPADWALCTGLFAGSLPRGVGLEVAGTVDAVGEGVDDIEVGDAVLGTPDWALQPSAGAAGVAILEHWALRPTALGVVEAAALPMAVSTAYAHLGALALRPGQTLLVHGAGTTVGIAAVQMALELGVRVVATAGPTYTDRLAAEGALVTAYGEGMVERVRHLAGGTPDQVLDAGPVSGALPDLVRLADGDPRRVLTMSDFEAAAPLGVRTTFTVGALQRHDVVGRYAERAAAGLFSVPVAHTFPLRRWREAMELSRSQRARGKLVLVP